MKDKCPNCGFEYGEFDVYCSRCGYKLSDKSKDAQLLAKQQVLDKFNENKKTNKRKFVFFNSNNSNKFDNMIFNFVICMIVISCVLLAGLSLSNKKHSNYKIALQYKNLIENPSQIPELREPIDIKDLKDNLSEVQNFLFLYLKYSKDSIEKKEQVFCSYLREINKLSHITNENLIKDDKHICYKIKSSTKAKKCAQLFSKELKSIGVNAYSDYNTIYLYPDYNFICNKYSKYLSSEIQNYLRLKARYNAPTSIGLELYISPMRLASKIYDFEKLYNSTTNSYVKDIVEEIIYTDFRKFIFTPSIYDTTTQEMTKDFERAFNSYLRYKKKSALYPVVMSYMDKKRSYSEENFKKDYPYKIFESSFDNDVQNNAFSDIFAQLRKNIFAKNNKYIFAYVYKPTNATWKPYSKDEKTSSIDFLITQKDENNDVSIYTNTFSLFQELNISKYGTLYLINGKLYIYNCDKLQLSKIVFNGRQFIINRLSNSDIMSVFPGIEIINIDSYSNYNINVDKANKKASFIVLSRYSQGYSEYELSAIQGKIRKAILPNIFYVDSNENVLVAFHGKSVNPEETSDNKPTYKFTVYTKGYTATVLEDKTEYIKYDEKTAQEQSKTESEYEPQFMPKIKQNEISDEKLNDDILLEVPKQNIEPPKESDTDE